MLKLGKKLLIIFLCFFTVGELNAQAAKASCFDSRRPIDPSANRPLAVDVYLRGSHSDWQAKDEFRFLYLGDNTYPLHAVLPAGGQFKIASADEKWSEQFWVGNLNNTEPETQGLVYDTALSLNWNNASPNNNAIFDHGEFLFTFTLSDGSKAGDKRVGYLHVEACKSIQTVSTALMNLSNSSLVSILSRSIDANDAVSIGPEGHIYVSEFGQFTVAGGTGTRVIKTDSRGEKTVFIDRLTGPLGSIWDKRGNFYVANANNGTNGEILKVDREGDREVLAEIDGWPANIVMDKYGSLFVGNFMRPTITKVGSNGEVEDFVSDERLSGTVGMAYDRKQERIFAANYNDGRIYVIDKHAKVNLYAQVPAQIGYLALLDGTLYATGINSNRIYQITSSGNVSVLSGTGVKASVDNLPALSHYDQPNGIAADSDTGILYISEYGSSNNLRKIQIR